MDENYKRSIKRAYERQTKKVRTREVRKLLEENSKRRRQARAQGGARQRDFAPRDEDEDGDWQAFQKMRPQAQLDLSAAKRAAAERAAPETVSDSCASALVVSVARDRVRLRLAGGERGEAELGGAGPRPAVGDEALLSELEDGRLRLVGLGPRRSVLSRPDPGNPRQERVLAANIDVAVVVASVVRPALKPALIDRFLIAIERGGARPLLCVNKSDLLADEAAREEVRDALAPYRGLGLEILWTSAETGEGLAELRAALAGRTCVFVGHSGVGKSTVLNALDPERARDTGTGREFDGKGRHTTSASELVELPGGTRLIDTPGIRSLGLWKIAPDELGQSFADFEEPAQFCRFRDCRHRSEPRCGVREAVDAGRVARERYATYLRILESLD